jgi:hypothetical protein
MVKKGSTTVREGAQVPCCAHCGERPWTDWRPDYQKYLCEKCFDEAPPSRLAILTAQRERRRRRGPRGRRGGEVAVLDELNFADELYG